MFLVDGKKLSMIVIKLNKEFFVFFFSFFLNLFDILRLEIGGN